MHVALPDDSRCILTLLTSSLRLLIIANCSTILCYFTKAEYAVEALLEIPDLHKPMLALLLLSAVLLKLQRGQKHAVHACVAKQKVDADFLCAAQL